MMTLKGGGLPKHGGGLPQVKKYLQQIIEDSEGEDEDEEDEDELQIAHRQLEARSWRDEGEDYLSWFLEEVLTDKQEVIVRANDEPKEMINLIKSFI